LFWFFSGQWNGHAKSQTAFCCCLSQRADELFVCQSIVTVTDRFYRIGQFDVDYLVSLELIFTSFSINFYSRKDVFLAQCFDSGHRCLVMILCVKFFYDIYYLAKNFDC
jgi:hypothetical protein